MAALSLVFDLLGRDVSASKAFNDVGDAADNAGKKGQGFGSTVSKAMGVAAGAIAAVGVASLGKDLINLASNAEQSMGGVEAVFKGYADTVKKSSKGAATALGLSGNSYRELATVIGSQLKNAGVPMDKLSKKTDGLIGMGADLAAMYGGTTADAVDALSSALKGEMDPIEKYGISLNDAALKAEAMSLGLYSGKGNLDANAKAMAVMSLVTKQGADAVGAFSRESDTAAGKQQRATAQWENLKTTIGDGLLPVWSGLMGFVGTTVIPKLSEVSDVAGQVFGVLFKGDFKGGPLSEDSGVVNTLFNIRDGITGIYDLVVKGDFTGALSNAFNIHEDNPVVGYVLDARDALLHAWDNLGDLWAGLDVSGLGTRIKDAAVAAGGDLLAGFKTGLDNGNWAPLGESIIGIVGQALSKIGELAGKAYEAFKNLMGKVDWVGVGMTLGEQVPTMLAGLALGILNFDIGGLLSGLGDHWVEVILALITLAFTPAKVVGKIGEALAKIPLAGKFLEWGLNGIKGLTDNIAGFVGDVIGRFVGGFIGEGTRIGTAFSGIFDTIYLKLLIWGDNVIAWFKGIPGALGDIAEYLGTTLRAKFDEILTYISAMFRDAVGSIADAFRPITTKLSEIADSVWTFLTTKFNGVKDSVVGIFTGIRDTVGTVWDGLLEKVKAPIRVVFNFVNGSMIGPINGLLGKFPGGLQIPFLPAFAGGGLLRGPGTGTSDSILGLSAGGVPTARVSNGEFVVNAAATKRNMGLLQAINGGLPGFADGGILGTIGSAISGAVGGTVDFAKDIAEKGARKVAELIINPLRNTAKGLIPGGNVIGDVVRGFVDKLADSVLGKAGEADQTMIGRALPGAAGAGVQRWLPVVLQALGMVGQPASLAQTVLRRMNQESGGNPMAANNWDVNAARGTPSLGLMQVIRPTFAANAMPGYANNIYDPLSNVLASMRYAINRYGSLSSAYNRVGGYETGTNWVPETGPYVLHKGEAVVPAAANAGWKGGGPMSLQLDGAATTALLEGKVVQLVTGVGTGLVNAGVGA